MESNETDMWIVLARFSYGYSGIVYVGRKDNKPCCGGSRSLIYAPIFMRKSEALKLARKARDKIWVQSAWIQRLDVIKA